MSTTKKIYISHEELTELREVADNLEKKLSELKESLISSGDVEATSSDEVRNVDFFSDTLEFARLYCSKTGKKPTNNSIDREFIIKMVSDEMQELREATDLAEEVDALLDAVYYILDHLSKTGLDIRPIWKLIHNANMTKFGDGGYMREDGKWMKPSDFTPPDDEIRKEIERQKMN